MPIATCLLSGALDAVDPDAVVAAWSERCGIGSEEMTLNLVPSRQGGKRYAAMASLSLPSSWSEAEVVALSEGLAGALAAALSVEASEVQVIVDTVASGAVVEDGAIVRW